ncbi:hypothetical protein MSAN_02210400 [Mycena sanguinolenta]|uniref:Uncharacterized protein n=1 Tax=Mycena sanguinolenta TaxID=230812 RepID=A0A8H6XE45_9AGAR|nr:hypothetical protein MSAN_02210400 [Mycena sanguinolenta]
MYLQLWALGRTPDVEDGLLYVSASDVPLRVPSSSTKSRSTSSSTPTPCTAPVEIRAASGTSSCATCVPTNTAGRSLLAVVDALVNTVGQRCESVPVEDIHFVDVPRHPALTSRAYLHIVEPREYVPLASKTGTRTQNLGERRRGIHAGERR